MLLLRTFSCERSFSIPTAKVLPYTVAFLDPGLQLCEEKQPSPKKTWHNLICNIRVMIHCISSSHVTLSESLQCICDRVCKNQPCPCKLHLVRYSTITLVLEQIISFCKLYMILHEFLHMWCKFRHVIITKT